MQARKGGVWVTPSTASVRIGGAWQTVRNGKAFFSGIWRDVASFIQPLTLAITGTARSSASTSFVQTATPTGGLAPFTYAWTTVTSLYPLTFSTPATASTQVATSSPDPYEVVTVACAVTDSLGSTATANKTLTLNASTLIGGRYL